MSDSILVQQITAIGAFTALSSSVADYLALDPARCTGLGDAPIRTTIEDAPGEDGGLIEPPLDGAQLITLVGDLVVTSTGMSNDPGYFAAVDALYQSLKTAINAGKTSVIDLVIAGNTLKCWKNAPLEPSWQNFYVCSVTFGLAVDVFA